MRDGYRVLDVDCHVTPSMEVLHRYASQALKESGTVRLSQSAYVAHEDLGYLTITITRTDPTGTEYVRYGVKQQDGLSGMGKETQVEI